MSRSRFLSPSPISHMTPFDLRAVSIEALWVDMWWWSAIDKVQAWIARRLESLWRLVDFIHAALFAFVSVHSAHKSAEHSNCSLFYYLQSFIESRGERINITHSIRTMLSIAFLLPFHSHVSKLVSFRTPLKARAVKGAKCVIDRQSCFLSLYENEKPRHVDRKCLCKEKLQSGAVSSVSELESIMSRNSSWGIPCAKMKLESSASCKRFN